MPNAPLKHVAGSTVTTVVDPRFGTGNTPTQPSGWGDGGGSTPPPPLTGDTYTAPGLYVPAGALDDWRAARDASSATLAEVVIFGDSTTYGAADANQPPGWFSWVKALKDAATAAGFADGGHGLANPDDGYVGYVFSSEAPTITNRSGFSDTPHAGRMTWTDRPGTGTITIEGHGTRVRLILLRSPDHGQVGYSLDGGPETIVDTYNNGAVSPYDFLPVLFDNLTEGPHTVTVRAVGGSPQKATAVYAEFNVEFLRSTGIAFHRNAQSGGLWDHHFASAKSAFSAPSMTPWNMGLQHPNTTDLSKSHAFYDGAQIGAKPLYRNIKLAIAQFGTNDLGGGGISDHDRLAEYAENAAYFARTCRSIGASGVLIAPPFSNVSTNTGIQQTPGRAKAALAGIATAYNVCYADFQEPLGYDLRNWQARHGGVPGPTRSHVPWTAYTVEGEWLWNNLLAL